MTKSSEKAGANSIKPDNLGSGSQICIKRDISQKYTMSDTVLGVGHFSKVF